MPENDPKNLAFYWSTLFVRTLFEESIRHVVISPGSRSTALTLAFAAHPGFTKHIVIDERSAAFMALGIGKASGIPAVLVCTSGTAVANYYPAVIEAAQSGVPIIAATADRPPHSRGIGSSQTIDQFKIFGDYSAFFHEAGEPRNGEIYRKRLQVAATQAVRYAISEGGLSHINFPFSKPFEPDEAFLKKIEEVNQLQSAKAFKARYIPEQDPMKLDDDFWKDVSRAKRPVIVAGPTHSQLKTDFISRLADELGAVILTEPSADFPRSGNVVQGFEGFLRNRKSRDMLKPDLILRFGAQPFSNALNSYLEENTDIPQISFVAGRLWNDGSLSAKKYIPLTAPLAVPVLQGNADKNWVSAWKSLENKYTGFKNNLLTESETLTDGFVFSEISKLLPGNAFSMLSNSFPVRDMAMFGRFARKEMYINRGAAGIDGITSTAIGLSAQLQKPGVLFIGDIAFLHDSNALLSAVLVEKPLVIILLNNGGGTIFRMLPVYSVKEKYTPYFETPQKTDIGALCAAYHIHHKKITAKYQLQESFEEAIGQNGIHVLECVTDADISMEQRKKLWDFKYQEQEKNG